MERLTNQYSELIKEVEKELYTLDITTNDKCIISYSEIPWFPGGQFSLTLIKQYLNKTFRLVQKSWDSDFDCKRFSSGVYNLDRLCIKTRSIEFPDNDQKKCENLINDIKVVPNKLEKEGYIILDGIDYKLTIKSNHVDKSYKWKIATNDIQLFTPLIDFLKNKIVD
jgi:hypothetical protein